MQFELAFEPERFMHREIGAGGSDPTRTLELVARWLVRDLVAKNVMRGVEDLTSTAFAVLHPDLGGRRIQTSETALLADYSRIKREIVVPLLGAYGTTTTTPARTSPGATAVSTIAPGSLPAIGGDRVPAGYKPVTRTIGGVAAVRGLARYSHDRLETVLRQLRDQGVLSVNDDDLDTFQRIANVETSGGTQALNTWDSTAVTIGFLQLTLQYGELQRWIKRAPAAFARYGIAVEPTRTYPFSTGKQPAIVGANTRSELRWNGWAQRFYLAGLDPEVIAAEVELGKVLLKEALAWAEKKLEHISGGYDVFKKAYDGSLPLRGLFHEARNNKPEGARIGIQLAARRALKEGTSDPARFYEIAKTAIIEAFVGMNDRSSGQNIVTKTATGARGS